MRAAILGTGFIANMHAQALRSLGIDISYAIDRNQTALEEFSKRWNIMRYGSDICELSSDEIDCVHICTPPALHYDMMKQLMEKGKNVICEKPVCLNAKEAILLARIAREKGLVCAVDFNIRYYSACQRMKKMIDTGELGPIYLVHGNYLQEFHALPAFAGWRYNKDLAGKMRVVTEIGSHWFDLAQYVSGEKIIAVSAMFGKFQPKRYLSENVMFRDLVNENSVPVTVDSEDAAAVFIRFESGAIGNVIISEVSHGRKNMLSLEITGSGKSVWWNSEQSSSIQTGEKDGKIEEDLFAFGNGFADTFKGMFDAVYTAIKDGSAGCDKYPDIENAACNVQICEAVYESANSNSKWIEIEKYN